MIAYTDYAGRCARSARGGNTGLEGLQRRLLDDQEWRRNRHAMRLMASRSGSCGSASTVARARSRISLSYLRFLLAASTSCLRLLISGKLDVVHVHNLPDFLVFAGLVPRLAGRKVVLDIHDSVPETFAAKFSDAPLVHRLLCLEERLSAAVAHKVICVNHPQRATLVARGIPDSKTFISMNVPDPRIFGCLFDQWACARPGAPQPRVSRHDGRAARRGPPDPGGGAVARPRPGSATPFVGSWRRPGRLPASGPATGRGREHRLQREGVSLEGPSGPTELDGSWESWEIVEVPRAI